MASDESLDKQVEKTVSAEGTVPPGREAALVIMPGNLLAGRYKVLGEIGRGGMGVVYRVEQVFLKEVQALKVLSAIVAGTNVARFQKEAQACRLLNHPNLIRIYDFALLEDGSPYLAMELVDGVTLSQELSLRGFLRQSEAIEIFIQVLDGLSYAHNQGVIHRDLKPSNIMLSRSDPGTGKRVVKIVDFGIAKITHQEGEESMALTRTGEVFGSPLYMSPEQCVGKAVDQRSDLYSIGCGLFQALTGVPPISGESALQTMMMHQTQNAPTLREASVGQEFSSDLEQVVARLLAKSPEDRYQSALDAKRDLEAVRDRQPLSWSKSAAASERKISANNWRFMRHPAVWISLGLLVVLVGREFYSSKQAATNSPAATETPAVIEASPQTEKSVKTEEPPDDQAMAQPPFAQIPIKQWRSGDWVLQFPDEHLGAIGFTERGFYPARGAVPLKMAGPLLFRPTRNGLRRDILARFRPDELYKILLRENENVDDNVMKSLARLTGLIELDLSGDTNVTDDGLAAISKLPKLVNLAVSGASVTGAGLANMHNLGQLAFLEADGLQDGRKVVPALARSKRIRDLYLRKDGLTDQDLEALGRVPSLEKLNVAVNRQITDLGISKLENIRQLKELNVVETGITPNCIQYLKRLPSGAWLWISTRGWTQEQRHQLNAALAGKRIMGSTEPITPD